ncbi:hypothetical protein DFH09DRAFT_1369950 [Mycena vulgaris]|nr:hypothetical protein DFH09DRAFT_1369950 [Mycena vulgaris]
MAPSTTSTTKTTTITTTRAKPLSTPIRLPSFARAPKHTAVPDADAGAELVSLWPRPRARRASSSSSTSSASSSSSASSASFSSSASSSSASSSSGSGSTSTKKGKSTKTRAVDMIVSGVSSLLIMPMPFLRRGPSPPSDASVPQTPRKRRFSPNPPRAHPPPAPRSTTSPSPKPPPTASRGGAQAAVLVLDAARVDARDSGTKPSFLYPHRALPSLLRAFALSQRTAPMNPHPTP